jgi:pilus assembly protein FimV
VSKSIIGFRLIAAALFLAPLLAHAAGLGRLMVLSPLGQPLQAEIEVVSLQPGEDESLSARLASPEAFRQAGIEMTPALVGLQFSVERREGRPVILLRTTQPVNEPFLDVLVELQWASGRLVREYTFLLDPPEYKGPQPIAAAPPAAPPEKPAVVPAPAKPAPKVEARPIAPAPAAAATHEVKKGDTLGAIARKTKPEGVTLNQMLIALYRANREAFIRENINLVRAGRILSIPDHATVADLNVAEVDRIVKTHMEEFAEYRRKLGAVVAAAPAAAPPRGREVTGRIAPGAVAPAPAEPKDQLRLSRADPAKPGAPASRAAREDDRVARDRALREAQSRVGELEKNVTDLQKLLELKNQQLAELEKKAGVKPAPAAPVAKAPEPAKPAAEKPAAAPAVVAKAPEAAKAPEPAKAPEAAKAPAEPAKPAAEAPKPPAEAAKPAAAPPKPVAEAPKAKPKPAAVPPKPAPERGLLEELIDDPVFLGGLAGVLVLLAGYGAWAWRRKKAAHAQFQDSVLGAAAGGGAAPSVFGAAAAAAAAAPAPSVAEAPAAAPAVAAPEAEEVDPIAEADVYMAYGRDAQAEEILKEALGKDPNRLAVHMKLLEIYAGRRDAKAFEQTALKVKSLTNGSGPDWDKAAALGRSVDPGNGLYGEGPAAAEAPAAAAAAAAAPALDFDIGGGAEPSAAAEPKPEAAPALDFDLGGAPAPEQKADFAAGGTLILDTAGPKAETTTTLDFDLGGGEGEKKAEAGLAIDLDATIVTPRPAEKPAPDADATVAVNFDINLDLGAPKAEPPPAAAEKPLDLDSISLDLGAPGEAPAAGGDAKWQEIATKLDLAKAYQEMGDKDGARELLNEVLKEGDAAQQSQAKQMLDSLG